MMVPDTAGVDPPTDPALEDEMTDTATVEETVGSVEGAVVTEAPAEKPAKEPKAPKVDPTKPCYCSFFEVGDFDPKKVGTDEEEIFSTGCEQTTKRQFAQGHDARLVSFLVDGHFDGYTLRKVQDGVAMTFATPAEAAKTASDALGAKAAAATQNRHEKVTLAATRKAEREQKKADTAAAKAKAKADKEAAKEQAKAEKASTPQAEVVAGSAEGDVPAGPGGTVKIKVGRWEFDAVVDEATGDATYTNGKGDEVVTPRDGYRLLAVSV